MVSGINPTLILWLSLIGTFVFGLSGGLAGVKSRLDLFGVVVLAGVVGLAGGVTRDVLIGVPPATFRDWRYLAAVGAAGVVSFIAGPTLERLWRGVQVFDAIGLAVFCVAGASKAIEFKLGPIQAIVLGVVAGIGGGVLRDILLRQVPTVLRHELYAIPALLGAGVTVVAHVLGNNSVIFPSLGALVCFATRIIGMRFGVDLPIAPSQRDRDITG